MTIRVMRMISRFIGAMPVLALCALTCMPVAAADQDTADHAAAAGSQKVLFAEKPAILILIEGEPVYQRLKGTDLKRITNEPAELIVMDGPPRYIKVDGTMLEYVENTTANVFTVQPQR
jgi:hypothetical protein